jgi:hypothetical protein
MFGPSGRSGPAKLDTRIQFVFRPVSVLESEAWAGFEGRFRASGGRKTGYSYSVSIGGSPGSRRETATSWFFKTFRVDRREPGGAFGGFRRAISSVKSEYGYSVVSYS